MEVVSDTVTDSVVIRDVVTVSGDVVMLSSMRCLICQAGSGVAVRSRSQGGLSLLVVERSAGDRQL